MQDNLNDLNTGEMIALSEAWLGSQKTLFLSIPAIAPLFPSVEQRHHELVAARNTETFKTELDDVTEQSTLLDNRHDHLARALDLSLNAAYHWALAQDPPDTSAAAKAEEARELLMPQGLSFINRSHASEAGNAAQMVGVAKGPIQPVLALIHLGSNVTALDAVNKLGQVGQALGESDRKAAELKAAQGEKAVTRSDVRVKMRAWVEMVGAVMSALKLSGAAEGDVKALTAPILEEARKATERRRARWAARKKEKESGGAEGGGAEGAGPQP